MRLSPPSRLLLKLKIRRLVTRRFQHLTLSMGFAPTPVGRAPRSVRLLLWSLATSLRAVPMTAHP
jgi:hypothetical protein